MTKLSPEQRYLLEKRLQQARTGAFATSMPCLDGEGTWPLSFSQERLWFLDRLYPGIPIYNLPLAFRLTGDIDRQALQDSFTEIVARHEVLRSVYVQGDPGLHQVILPPRPVPMPVIDLRHFPQEEREKGLGDQALEDQAWLDQTWLDQAIALAWRPFDLQKDLMLRVALFSLAKESHILLLVQHHIATDGLSIRLMFRELALIYTAKREGKAVNLPPLKNQYKDYAAWQREVMPRPEMARQRAYWQKQLAGLSPIELPADRSRPVVTAHTGGTRYFGLGSDRSAKLAAIAREENVTVYMLLLTALSALLYRYNHQEDFAIGTPVANRALPGMEDMIGFFVNMLVIRCNLSGKPTFRELLGRTRGIVLEALPNQDIPFEQVIAALQPERLLGRNPLFEVTFQVLSGGPPRPDFAGIQVNSLPVDFGIGMFDLDVTVYTDADQWSSRWEYNDELFDGGTIDRLISHYLRLLDGVIANIDEPVDTIPLLSPQERRQILVDWNDTAAPTPMDSSLHHLFERQVKDTPEAVAVSDCFQAEMTYEQLNNRANRLAHYLQGQGIGPGAFVGLACGRSVEMMVALLAILKAGAAFMPLDPAYPAARLGVMMADARPALVLTEREFLTVLEAATGQMAPPLVCMDGIKEALEEMPNGNPAAGVTPQDLAYIIFTSGSTGRPKGVQISHRAVVNALAGHQIELGLKEADRFLAISSLSFDASLLQLFLPLICGARVVIASREIAMDGKRLQQLLIDAEISVMDGTPATWRMLLAAGWPGKPDLTILSGGEALAPDLAEQLLPRGAALWNGYGPTETTISSTEGKITSPEEPISIGRPIANTSLYVLDEQMQPAPIGVVGQLFIGGAGLARGYLNRPGLTAAKFIPNPFVLEGSQASTRIYHTGDLARYLPDGRLVYLGRSDNQVKIRGYRIELGEIEAILGQHRAVAQAVVVVGEDGAHEKQLVAYWTPAPGYTVESEPAQALRTFLRSQLPDFMVPSRFIALEALPLMLNGKINRHALPDPAEYEQAGSFFVAAKTPIEQAIVAIWEEVLDRKPIGVTDDFFSLGGHSLNAARIMSRICDRFDIDLPLRTIFETPTIRGIVSHISGSIPQTGSEVGQDRDEFVY